MFPLNLPPWRSNAGQNRPCSICYLTVGRKHFWWFCQGSASQVEPHPHRKCCKELIGYFTMWCDCAQCGNWVKTLLWKPLALNYRHAAHREILKCKNKTYKWKFSDFCVVWRWARLLRSRKVDDVVGFQILKHQSHCHQRAWESLVMKLFKLKLYMSFTYLFFPSQLSWQSRWRHRPSADEVEKGNTHHGWSQGLWAFHPSDVYHQCFHKGSKQLHFEKM